jgi:hypothetical protein
VSSCRLGFVDHNEYIVVRNSSLDIPALLKVPPPLSIDMTADAATTLRCPQKSKAHSVPSDKVLPVQGYESYGALAVSTVVFGSAGHRQRQQDGVLRSYQ